MSQTPNRYITPLYDTILDKAIASVLASFSSGSSGQAWDSLLTLYDVLPKDIKEKCKKIIDEVETHIAVTSRKRGYTQSDALFRRLYLEQYVGRNKHILLEKIIDLLTEAHYLDRKAKVIPTNAPSQLFEQ